MAVAFEDRFLVVAEFTAGESKSEMSLRSSAVRFAMTASVSWMVSEANSCVVLDALAGTISAAGARFEELAAGDMLVC